MASKRVRFVALLLILACPLFSQNAAATAIANSILEFDDLAIMLFAI